MVWFLWKIQERCNEGEKKWTPMPFLIFLRQGLHFKKKDMKKTQNKDKKNYDLSAWFLMCLVNVYQYKC